MCPRLCHPLLLVLLLIRAFFPSTLLYRCSTCIHLSNKGGCFDDIMFYYPDFRSSLGRIVNQSGKSLIIYVFWMGLWFLLASAPLRPSLLPSGCTKVN
ncbi:unnamed protein product [Taenia asiatica]|uniref:Secreted protein n=1 Tax=Taenia asiatica TaxID=60517 RepID=A0A0R3W738_TAEAS|nr:unnamed protein product [Taenia asiatica]